MKFSHLTSSLTLALIVMSPVASIAADDNSVSKDQPTKSEMAPHSHMQEKGYGAPVKKKSAESKPASEQSDNSDKSTKSNIANDRSKHYHPRDGK